MKLYNNTSNDVFYSISSPGTGNCGTITAGGTTDLPFYDNKQSLNVGFSATPASPSKVTPFTVTIPNTGVGKVVTIGLFFE